MMTPSIMLRNPCDRLSTVMTVSSALKKIAPANVEDVE